MEKLPEYKNIPAFLEIVRTAAHELSKYISPYDQANLLTKFLKSAEPAKKFRIKEVRHQNWHRFVTGHTKKPQDRESAEIAWYWFLSGEHKEILISAYRNVTGEKYEEAPEHDSLHVDVSYLWDGIYHGKDWRGEAASIISGIYRISYPYPYDFEKLAQVYIEIIAKRSQI